MIVFALVTGCSGKAGSRAEWPEPVEEIPTLGLEEPMEEAAAPTEEVLATRTPPPFCEDRRVQEFAERFVWAVQTEDGEWLGGAITNRGGLNIRLEWWNTNVHFSKDEATQLFNDETSYDWGIADGSGAPVKGSFMEIVQPKLLDVVEGEYVFRCDTLDFGVASGGSAGLVEWPEDIPARHYIAIYRPAPADQDLDWRTWVLGFEYIDGIPYISYLVQYHWEI